MAESGAADHAVIKVDSATGYPCRHCLRWAKPGERVILFPYASIPAGHPYSETGPIFVHAEPCERYGATRAYPADFRNGRAFRAYDANYNMIDAEVANANEPEAVIEKLLQNSENRIRGCAKRYSRLFYLSNPARLRSGVKFAARISSMRQRMRVLNLLTWKQWNFFLRVKRCIAR